MKFALTIIEIWAGASLIITPIFLALLHTKRIRFDPVEHHDFRRMVKGVRK